MRGNQVLNFPNGTNTRTIPAYAGKPYTWIRGVGNRRDYPRVCGETRIFASTATDSLGLSPRMRGNQMASTRTRFSPGTIPAYAGKPCHVIDTSWWWWDYPRVCGETDVEPTRWTMILGLSPRMRGNQTHEAELQLSTRTIPAYAGKPGSCSSRVGGNRDYPRVCGETGHDLRVRLGIQGLSPRMRGNLRLVLDESIVGGTIPAYAGKPSYRPARAKWLRDYPRVCGETSDTSANYSRPRGLSPRMRGNLLRLARERTSAGTIPAYAGKPCTLSRLEYITGDYPRVCGETRTEKESGSVRRGLSPRMRGNPH